mgnify:CR=1 FL=1
MNPIKLLTPHSITTAASKITGKPVNVIRGATRVSSIVSVRDLCFKICKENMTVCDRDLAPYFNRERSTIRYALIRVEKNLAASNQYQLMYELIKEELGLIQLDLPRLVELMKTHKK